MTLDEFIQINNNYTSEQLQQFSKSVGVNSVPTSYDNILSICGNRKDLSERLIKAIPQSYGDEGLTLIERVKKHNLLSDPQKKSLNIYETRIWYKWQESMIYKRLDYSKPLEDVAKQAYKMRNNIRTKARLLMSDTNWSQYLFENEKNRTFDDIVNYYKFQGYGGDDLWNIIIEKSMTSRDL